MHSFRKQEHQGSNIVNILVSIALLTYSASAGIQLAFVSAAGGSISLTFHANAGKAFALALWSLIFLYLIWWGGAKEEDNPKAGAGSNEPSKLKPSALQFGRHVKYRYIAVGFFMFISSFIAFGNPLLTLLYLGESGASEFIDKADKINFSMDMHTTFYVLGCLTCYSAGVGASLLAYAVFLVKSTVAA